MVLVLTQTSPLNPWGKFDKLDPWGTFDKYIERKKRQICKQLEIKKIISGLVEECKQSSLLLRSSRSKSLDKFYNKPLNSYTGTTWGTSRHMIPRKERFVLNWLFKALISFWRTTSVVWREHMRLHRYTTSPLEWRTGVAAFESLGRWQSRASATWRTGDQAATAIPIRWVSYLYSAVHIEKKISNIDHGCNCRWRQHCCHTDKPLLVSDVSDSLSDMYK